MIFAIYKGPQNGPHRLTPGKLYMARPGFEDAGAVDADHLRLTNDDGKVVTIAADTSIFDLPEQVHAVILKDISVFEKGDVVQVCDADNGFLEVCGQGFFNENLFELLDRTNVTPGIFVLDKFTLNWIQVAQVDDRLNIAGPSGVLRPLHEFRFAVGDGGVMAEPLVKCVNADGTNGELIEGKMYRLSSMAKDGGLVSIVNETGKEETYMLARFSFDL